MRACARYWERYGQYVFRGREWGGGARTSERVGVQCRAETAWRGGGCSARNLPPMVQLMPEGLIVGIPRTPMHCVFVREGVCVCVCVCMYVYGWVCGCAYVGKSRRAGIQPLAQAFNDTIHLNPKGPINAKRRPINPDVRLGGAAGRSS